MKNLWTRLRAILSFTIAAIATIFSIYALVAVIMFVLPTEVRRDFRDNVFLRLNIMPSFAAQTDLDPAISAIGLDVNYIENIVSRCVDIFFHSITNTNTTESTPSSSSRPSSRTGFSYDERRRRMPTEYTGISQLSLTIAQQRVQRAREVASANNLLTLTTWLTVLIGLITTVLVALGSTDFGKADAPSGKWIRAGALTFTAIGTACAAIVAFYAPRQELLASSSMLSGLQRLHEEIVTDIWNLPCVGESKAGVPSASTRLADWSRRYREVQAAADAASRPARTENSAGAPGGGVTPGAPAPAPAPAPR